MDPLTANRARYPAFRAFCLICGLLLIFALPATAQLIYADSFSYPDGPIETAPGSPWVWNYFPTNQISVVSGRLLLTETNQPSVRYDFPQAFSAGALYARMVVNVSRLPSGNGNFFAFFRVINLDNLRGRIWVATNGAAPGRFRLGATTIFYPPTLIAQDLFPGTNYTLVMRYVVTNNHTTLWLNPASEDDTVNRVDDLTDVGPANIGHFGFAQPITIGTQSDIGNLTVDDLRIGRTFEEVMPSVAFKSISNSVAGVISLRASGQATSNYIFQATTNLGLANWVNLSTNAADTNGNFNVSDSDATNLPRRFYRLQRQ